MGEITIDGMHEGDFRRSIEDLLRRGEADVAADRLRRLIEPYTTESRILPLRFRGASAADITIAGWGDLEDRLRKYDRPEHPITAMAVATWEDESKPRKLEDGDLLPPLIFTSYFSDEAFPFSEADRHDLLGGYSSCGCQWDGDSEGFDQVLDIHGVDDLYGAVIAMERRLLAMDEPPEEEIRAGTLASCYLSVIIHQALRNAISRQGLPRPLCVMTGNSGIYPFFDAPVMSTEEYLAGRVVQPIDPDVMPEMPDAEEPALPLVAEETAEEGSLLSIGLRRDAKKPVLVLEAADAAAGVEDMARAQLAGLPGSEGWAPPSDVHADLPPADEPPPPPEWDESQPDIFADPAIFREAVEAELGAVDEAGAEPVAEASPVAVPPQEDWHSYCHESYALPRHDDGLDEEDPDAPVLAPGQDPITRGHALRKSLTEVEIHPLRESLLRRILGWFRRR